MLVSGLFAGIGGFELGFQQAGHRVALLCDDSPYAQQVLRQRWPGARLHADVADLEELPRGAEVATAGFPCQNLSMAGDKKGLDGGKSGIVNRLFHLLERRRVPWVVVENVYFMLHLRRGKAIASILGQMEELGYRWAYRVVDSRSFGLAQRRRRVFIVASRAGDPRQVLLADDSPESKPPKLDVTEPVGTCPVGFYWTEGRAGHGLTANAIPPLKAGSTLAIPSPPAVFLPSSGRVVTPPIEAVERLQGFPPGWTSALRKSAPKQRWRLLGNAVSVPVAQWIGHRLAAPGEYDDRADTPLEENAPWPTAAWNVNGCRMAARVSEYPRRKRPGRLSAFATEKWPNLSERALRGFTRRARQGRLRYPPGFLDALEANLGNP